MRSSNTDESSTTVCNLSAQKKVQSFLIRFPLIKTKHAVADSKHIKPDSLKVLILWISFMRTSMYLSNKWGSFTDEKRRQRRTHEKKDKQR